MTEPMIIEIYIRSMMVPCEPKKVIDLKKYIDDSHYQPKSIWDKLVNLKRMARISKDARKERDKIKSNLLDRKCDQLLRRK